MTCREKLMQEHGYLLNEKGIPYGCPMHFGYLPKPDYCNGTTTYCEECWNREVPKHYYVVRNKYGKYLVRDQNNWSRNINFAIVFTDYEIAKDRASWYEWLGLGAKVFEIKRKLVGGWFL